MMHRWRVSAIGAVVGSVLGAAVVSAARAVPVDIARSPQARAAVPRFEAVSVKPCDPDADAGGARGGARSSPNRLFLPCFSVRSLIRQAFLPGQNPRDVDRLVG